MRFFLLVALFGCAMSASLPRVPSDLLLGGLVPKWDPNEERIVGGVEAVPHSIPWQVAMESLTGSLRCGGSVLNPTTILTAAHCVEGINCGNYQIRAGDHDRNRDEGTEQIVRIAKCIQHEGYNSAIYDNDIALLILEKPLEINEFVQPINLPAGQYNGLNVPDDTNVTISGWGSVSSGGALAPKLLEVSTVVVSDEKCNSSYSGGIRSSMMCAGYNSGGVDSCQGDSGGPLFTCNDSTRRNCTVWGIVSWGRGCALPNYPGVYAEVNYFLLWLAANIPK